MPTINGESFEVDLKNDTDHEEYIEYFSEWKRALALADTRCSLTLGAHFPSVATSGVGSLSISEVEGRWPLWQHVMDRLSDEYSLSSSELNKAWSKAVLGSRCFKTASLRYPDDIMWALASFVEHKELNASALSRLFQSVCQTNTPKDSPQTTFNGLNSAWLQTLTSQKVLDEKLRQFRRILLCRHIISELNDWGTLEHRMRTWSAVADFCLQAVADWHYQHLSSQWGYPVDDNGLPQPLLVMSLGKLGARELNLSSDIDLMFVFPSVGQLHSDTMNRGKERSSAEFFHRVGQGIIQSIDRVTPHGFVFRVDMRLRPYGNSGSLVSSFAALERYYLTEGREWERFAMIKARVSACAGVFASHRVDDIKAAWQAHRQSLWDILRPFSYRRYVDYSAIKALRNLKGLIQREVRRKGMEDDVKLGWGGIREIEFIAQVFQLIRGGRDIALQERRLLRILPTLSQLGCLPKQDVEKLHRAYHFLRRTEHVIQAWEDRQTQTLPNSSSVQARMAWVLGFHHWSDFLSVLNDHRRAVHHIFQRVIEDERTEISNTSDLAEQFWRQMTRLTVNPEGNPQNGEVISTLESLAALFPMESEASLSKVCTIIWQSLQHRPIQQISDSARERLDHLMLRTLSELSRIEWKQKGEDTEHNALSSNHTCSIRDESLVTTFERLTSWLESVAGRSNYFLMLSENPPTLLRFLQLLSVSPWIAELLRAHPILLEEVLLDDNSESSSHTHSLGIPSRNALSQSLRQQLLRIPENDEEQIMESLRFFRLSHSLRVASAELTQSLPLMRVSDYLTWLAEAVLEEVLNQAWGQMVERFGTPPSCSGIGTDKGFVIIGYGKLGGLEMSHQSDLDLVFIYRGERQARTEGAKRSLDIPTFYTRLGQKIIHILTTRTWLGRLYEVDMRLRPSGNSGMLVTRWEAFDQYQRHDAWVWEHQALVRARPIAGCSVLGKAFDQLRSDVLSERRDLTQLRQSVIEMREKMREHLGSPTRSVHKGHGASAHRAPSPMKREPSKALNFPQKTIFEGAADLRQYFHLKHNSGGIVDIEFMVQYAVLAWAAQAPQLLIHTDNIRLLETLDVLERLPNQTARQLIEAYQAMRRLGHRLALQQRSLLVSGDLLTVERDRVISAWRDLLGSGTQ